MSVPESVAPDQPFPGARSQVRGPRGEPEAAPPMVWTDGRRQLPLEASPARWNGWAIRLPCRSEELTIGKRVVVYERVSVRKRQLGEMVRLDASVRREQLRMDRSRLATGAHEQQPRDGQQEEQP